MSDVLLWIVLATAILTALLLVIHIGRSSQTFNQIGKDIRDELRQGREETRNASKGLREELSGSLKASNDTLSKTLQGMVTLQQNQLDAMTKELRSLTQSNQEGLERIRKTFDTRVKELQEGNERKLDQMRKTVDEKLHDTLEKRLGESFKLVSERLEAVQKGLGEMQTLATGVGDLKRVLTNVKARGTWAEVQLGAILEQILAPGQYDRNVRLRPETSEVVEYAVRLPGPKDDPDTSVWLPIDSKFPQEDYLRVQEAAEHAENEMVQKASEALSRTIRAAAKDISEKYLNPPHTTDFGIMFLATEGLYAEVLRHPSLVDELLNRYRVVVAGPTTLAAILNSLRIGFQTLAIEQQAAEVWTVLRAVKTEFGKFGQVLDKVKRQLSTASNTIDKTSARTRAMARKLRSVEELPHPEAARILELAATEEESEATQLESAQQSSDSASADD